MTNEYDEMGGWQAFKSGEWFNNLIQKALLSYWSKADSRYFRDKYPNLNEDQLAKKIIALTAKNAAAIGGATGVAMSTNEVVALLTGAEGGIGLPANIAIAAASIGGEIISVTHCQLKMIADLGKLYQVPLDAEDPEDIWIIFAYAMGGSVAELAGAFGMRVGGNLTKTTIKKVISKEVLKQIQKIGRIIGVKILQKSIIKYAVPIMSIAIGSSWNYVSTKSVGKIAQRHFIGRRDAILAAGDVDDGPIIDQEPEPTPAI